ncbi:type VI secretion-associated protein [Photobacterium proteolyticum]|uniref:Type VI secretion-associated protein n=2 Tax=Photobacterium TaxID=657 RepID=A0A1Q9G750_9GAMM|nr:MULTISPECIES: type VI secretion system-associated protein TagF [Photobacterium]NBI55959.1 type VI secretion system-associated protein TagF [Photobacterium alginatilyticum]OLQ70153.1 type VI secretion-associated protein [Photobacterium proteolyticum]
MSDNIIEPAFGYFGKIPDRGDFIQAHLSPEFVKPWNDWLQATLAVSREQLGEQWLDYYLTSPIWHFVLSPGVCGDSCVAGTLMPSIDQVGRHFYFTLASAVDCPAVRCWLGKEWSLMTEEHVLKLLDEPTELDVWISELDSAAMFQQASLYQQITQIETDNSDYMVLQDGLEYHSEFVLHRELRQRFERYCIWWTSGSEQIAECTLVTKGMPLVSQFSAMLDGNWEKWGW